MGRVVIVIPFLYEVFYMIMYVYATLWYTDRTLLLGIPAKHILSESSINLDTSLHLLQVLPSSRTRAALGGDAGNRTQMMNIGEPLFRKPIIPVVA